MALEAALTSERPGAANFAVLEGLRGGGGGTAGFAPPGLCGGAAPII